MQQHKHAHTHRIGASELPAQQAPLSGRPLAGSVCRLCAALDWAEPFILLPTVLSVCRLHARPSMRIEANLRIGELRGNAPAQCSGPN